MDWGHGYYTTIPYTTGFFRETAPNWLDFAVLIRGQNPPRQREGEPFRYLDLGCGMGFGLCLLAGLYPEAEFVGVDFNPDHIAHARTLAEDLKLSNVRFMEGDFLQLRLNPTPLGLTTGEPGLYHYVVAHGVATWVGPEVREALLALGSAALAVRGLFYVSYSCQPGWLALSTYQQLVKLELRRSGGLPSPALFQQTAARLQQLLGEEQTPTPLARLLPSLRQELNDLPRRDLNYLYGEYGHERWQPQYVADLHLLARQHRLTAVSTATLPELFDDLLAPSLRDAVLGESEPLLRQTLLDLATFKGFRRDIFVRGLTPMSPEQRRRRIESVKLRLLEAPPLNVYEFSTSFGLIRGNSDAYRTVEAALANCSRELGQLVAACDQPLSELEPIVALLLYEGRLAIDRGEAGEEARPSCERLNHQLLAHIREGWSYSYLAAPSAGSGIPINLIEAEVLADPGIHPIDASWAKQLESRLASIRISVTPESGSDASAEILKTATVFQQRRLRWCHRLGLTVQAETKPHES